MMPRRHASHYRTEINMATNFARTSKMPVSEWITAARLGVARNHGLRLARLARERVSVCVITDGSGNFSVSRQLRRFGAVGNMARGKPDVRCRCLSRISVLKTIGPRCRWRRSVTLAMRCMSSQSL